MWHSTRQVIYSELQVVAGPSCAPCQHAHTHSSAWASSFTANWVHRSGTGWWCISHFVVCYQNDIPLDPILLVEADTNMFSLWSVRKAFVPVMTYLLRISFIFGIISWNTNLKPRKHKNPKTKTKKNKPSLPRPLSRELYFKHIHVTCQIFIWVPLHACSFLGAWRMFLVAEAFPSATG